MKKAIAAYAQAEKLTSRRIPANYWNILCRFGSLHGYAADVMRFCEKALALAPNDGAIIDSRGIARALTDNTKGAIEDFNFSSLGLTVAVRTRNYDDNIGLKP